jgi:adenosylmethionine-8-amino-7-oxononanoate aminotransferase
MTSSPPVRSLHPLAERDLRVVWHPCTQMKDHEWLPLIPIERGEGVWLYGFGRTGTLFACEQDGIVAATCD